MTLNFVTETEVKTLQYSPEFSALIEAQLQVELAKAEVVKAQDEFLRAATQAGRSELAASEALANKNATDVNLAQTLAALNLAVGIVFGQNTGIGGVSVAARIRANQIMLGPQFSFTRSGSGGTFIDRNLNLVAASANTPRFDYDLETGQPLGFLVETAKTNLCLHSNNLADAGWVKTGYTPTKTFVGLRGQANEAWSIVNEGASGHIFRTITGLTPNTQYTFSFFARNNGGANAYIGIRDEGTLAFTARNFGSEIINNRPRRISISATTGPTTTSLRVYLARDQSNVNWVFQDAQLEEGQLTSYAGESTTSTVLRNLDIPNLNLATLNLDEGTILIRGRNNTSINTEYFTIFQDSGNRIDLFTNGLLHINIGGVNYSVNLGSSGLGQYDNFAISYSRNRIAACRNGGTVVVANIPNFLTVATPIQFRSFGTSQSKHIHTFKYQRRAISDAQLQIRSNPNLFFGFENGDVALNADLSDAAFTNINAIQRLPGRTDMPFYGTGTNQTYTFQLNYDAEVQDVFTTGSTFTRPTPGTVIPRGTNITVTHNAPVGTVMILAFLPILQ